jgi:hypothetical protein
VSVVVLTVLALMTVALVVVVVLSVNSVTPEQQKNNDLQYLFLIADQELPLIVD